MRKQNAKYLQNYEHELLTALFADYSRPVTHRTLIDLDSIYTEETGKNLHTNYSCSSCILRLLRELANVYFSEYPERLPERYGTKFEKYKIKTK